LGGIRVPGRRLETRLRRRAIPDALRGVLRSLDGPNPPVPPAVAELAGEVERELEQLGVEAHEALIPHNTKVALLTAELQGLEALAANAGEQESLALRAAEGAPLEPGASQGAQLRRKARAAGQAHERAEAGRAAKVTEIRAALAERADVAEAFRSRAEAQLRMGEAYVEAYWGWYVRFRRRRHPAVRPVQPEWKIPEWVLRDEPLYGFDGPSEILITLPDSLVFASGSSTFAQAAESIMNRLVWIVTVQYPLGAINVTEHADSVPMTMPEGNPALFEQRADSVRAYLLSHGVSAKRLNVTGKASDDPIADDRTASRRAENRRLAVTITLQDGSV
jgi:flagellar motor protein MotB